MTLDRVLLHRDDPWFLEFHLTAHSHLPRWGYIFGWRWDELLLISKPVKIVVPHGEEETAERVLDFFTRRTVNSGEKTQT